MHSYNLASVKKAEGTATIFSLSSPCHLRAFDAANCSLMKKALSKNSFTVSDPLLTISSSLSTSYWVINAFLVSLSISSITSKQEGLYWSIATCKAVGNFLPLWLSPFCLCKTRRGSKCPRKSLGLSYLIVSRWSLITESNLNWIALSWKIDLPSGNLLKGVITDNLFLVSSWVNFAFWYLCQ